MSAPVAALLDFLDGLPATIGDVVMTDAALIVLPDLDEEDTDFADIGKRLVDRLRASDPVAALNAAIVVAGVLDVVFANDWRGARHAADLTARHHPENRLLSTHAAKMPLMVRHRAQAADRWRCLRESVLSPPALAAARIDTLLAERPW